MYRERGIKLTNLPKDRYELEKFDHFLSSNMNITVQEALTKWKHEQENNENEYEKLWKEYEEKYISSNPKFRIEFVNGDGYYGFSDGLTGWVFDDYEIPGPPKDWGVKRQEIIEWALKNGKFCFVNTYDQQGCYARSDALREILNYENENEN